MRYTALCLGLLAMVSCSKNSSTPTPVTPTLTATEVTAAEGNGGTSLMEFTFRLSSASTAAVSARISSGNGFAIEGEDYKKVDQVIQFAPGETSKKISVEIVADDAREGNDDFVLSLSDAVNCTIPNRFIKGTITNDDTKVVFGTGGPSSPGSYPGLNLVWADEFSGASVNTANWNYEVGDGCPGVCGWGNNELEWYTEGENASIQNGALIIEARAESRGGKNYTSSRMTTKTKKPFKFGRMDIRAKLPKGRGIWPAIWMMPQDNVYGGWPKSGEIDIMEFLGHETNKVYSTVHFGPGPASMNISKNITGSSPYCDSFHVYSLVWETDRMRFYADDVLISDVKRTDLSGQVYPFNESFFFILNLAVGGNWPGNPDASTYFPQWLIVDYIRVFQ